MWMQWMKKKKSEEFQELCKITVKKGDCECESTAAIKHAA